MGKKNRKKAKKKERIEVDGIEQSNPLLWKAKLTIGPLPKSSQLTKLKHYILSSCVTSFSFASPCVTLRHTTSNYIKLRWIESSCVKFRSSFPRGICFSFPSYFLVSLRFPGPGLPPGAKFVGQGEACPPSCSSSRRPPSVFRFGSTDSSLERSFSPIWCPRRPEKHFFRRLHKLIDYLYLTTYDTKRYRK